MSNHDDRRIFVVLHHRPRDPEATIMPTAFADMAEAQRAAQTWARTSRDGSRYQALALPPLAAARIVSLTRSMAQRAKRADPQEGAV